MFSFNFAFVEKEGKKGGMERGREGERNFTEAGQQSTGNISNKVTYKRKY